MLNTNCLQRPTKTSTTATTTTTATATTTTAKLQEELNWLEYKGALDPLLCQYAEKAEAESISTSALMGLNTPAFLAYLERVGEIAYEIGAFNEEEAPSVTLPPIPRKWTRGLPRSIINWVIDLGYCNGMLDQ